ncbi:type I-C CRISPR-associated protein Cas8c/Csd1 [Megasphaera paucivorans]|uniref:CRISPR-associated protein Csd1 n=1 Tax=Megasphaera paucivorans TaxID=349095 RepID=A0A1G9UWZ9_9FIRM|nr:type I-C CRISPR-associated protein Cas8c/Csd1 [Megasphaera paucivorans]SDM64468.1 CRISPR-associated protein Csd1 [Megasphaera paucivorans]
MLIKALCDYYDILSKNGKVLAEGYSYVGISYLICLSSEGKIDEIIDCRKRVIVKDKKGKEKNKLIPKDMLFPLRTQRPTIDANIIEHRPVYLFGLDESESNEEQFFLTSNTKHNKAMKSHADFVEKNLKFLEEIKSPVVNAYRAFIANWSPDQETQNPMLLNLNKGYASSGYAFCLSGYPNQLLHEDELLNQHWTDYYQQQKLEVGQKRIGQCAVIGKEAYIARIHNKIKGVAGGLATGAVLMSYKNPAECSYGNEQSYNSNISELAMKKYTETLNFLLKNQQYHKIIEELTTVFWAVNENEECEKLIENMLFFNSETMNDEQTVHMLRELIIDAKRGKIVAERIASTRNIDTNVDFYMVGFKPNSSRLAIKFIYHKKFGEILQNVAKYQNDLQISPDIHPISFWKMSKELVSPQSSVEKINPALLAKLFESILCGANYPISLLATIVRRVKTDKAIAADSHRIRAGIIKACINRMARFSNQKEELKLGLDKENKNPAYLSGRLFAVLEKIQRDASGNNLNRTIKDVYFASAASKPAFIFPKILKLAQNHLSKLKSAPYYNKLIGEIINELDGTFPDTLLLVEQGKFMIGYYQQNQILYTKKEEEK